MNGLHGTFASGDSALAAFAAHGRARLRRASPEIDLGVRHISRFAMKGLDARVIAEADRAGRIEKVRRVEAFAGRLNEGHGQSEVAEVVFGAAAHRHTVRLGSMWVGISRVDARRILAMCLVEQAARITARIDMDDASMPVCGFEDVDPADDSCEPIAFESGRPEWPVTLGDQKWCLLRAAPLLAVLHVSAAGCNSPAGLLAAFRAADDAVLTCALDGFGPDALVGALFHTGLCEARLRELVSKPAERTALLPQLRRALLAFDALSRNERNGYRNLILCAARAAASAARERVLFSRRGILEAERNALDEIEQLVRLSSMHAGPTSTASASA